jgi:hypothetical protein
LLGLNATAAADRANQRRAEWDERQREQFGDDWEHSGGETYDEHLFGVKPDAKDDPIKTAKKKFGAIVKLAFHPSTTTEQALAAIDGARRWADKSGVSIINITDNEYLDLDEIILIKRIAA